jgi:hypothetical protein
MTEQKNPSIDNTPTQPNPNQLNQITQQQPNPTHQTNTNQSINQSKVYATELSAQATRYGMAVQARSMAQRTRNEEACRDVLFRAVDLALEVSGATSMCF